MGGLSCGRPLRGRVALLGGPLSFLSELREAFARRLARNSVTLELFADAQYAVAHGAALENSPQGAQAEAHLWTLENLIEAVGREAVNLVDKRNGPKPLLTAKTSAKPFLIATPRPAFPRLTSRRPAAISFWALTLAAPPPKAY